MSTLFTALTGGGTRTARRRGSPRCSSRGTCCARCASAAVAVQVVAAHRDPAGDAVARHGNAAPRQARGRSGRGAPPDPGGPPSAPTRRYTSRRGRRTGGRGAQRRDPQSGLTEIVLNIPTTAHILGGAVIGDPPSAGHRRRLPRVRLREPARVRRSAVPANSGVNPSLTITALAERGDVKGSAEGRREPPARELPWPPAPLSRSRR